METPEGMFRDLCENANDLIQSVSPEGRFLYVNRAWLEALGYTREEVEELKVFDVIHPDCRANCQEATRVMPPRPRAQNQAAYPIREDARAR